MSAVISGEVEHPELELSAISVTIPVGEAFDPYSYILSARDSDGTDRQGDVQVGTVPDTSVPGTYQVVYTLTSSDGMEQVKKYLTVATPHCSLSRLREEPGLARRIRQMTKEINERLEEDRIPLQLLAGMEIMAEETRVEELAGALREESLLTPGGEPADTERNPLSSGGISLPLLSVSCLPDGGALKGERVCACDRPSGAVQMCCAAPSACLRVVPHGSGDPGK